jgi:hypothetical protein
MKTLEAVKTRANVGVKISDSVSKGSLCIMAGVSAFIGAWATLTFIMALFSGPAKMLKGLLNSIF